MGLGILACPFDRTAGLPWATRYHPCRGSKNYLANSQLGTLHPADFSTHRRERGSAEVGAFQPSSAALKTMGVYTFTDANKQKTAEERKVDVPLRYQLARGAGEHERDAGGEGREATPHPHDKQNVGPPTRPGW